VVAEIGSAVGIQIHVQVGIGLQFYYFIRLPRNLRKCRPNQLNSLICLERETGGSIRAAQVIWLASLLEKTHIGW
jgi:hypothetical protein